MIRRLLLLAVPVAILVGTTVVGLFLAAPVPVAVAAQSCQATLGPTAPGAAPGDGAADAAKLDAGQRAIATSIITTGLARALPARAWQVAIQAGMTESQLRNLDHGDQDSLGVFQMRPSMGWGTPAQLQDVDYEINKFYDVLITVRGWDQMRPGDAAQAVERSGFPDRYHSWEAMAAYLIGNIGNIPDPTGCGSVNASATAQTVINAAKKWLGTPYSWGGGNTSGPSAGESGVGFDCSGLTLYAYYQAGITLPRRSTDQYNAGAHVPFEQAQPGDLLFWADATGNPAAIHHVGIYLGDNQVLHAPDTGDVVKISTVWQNELVHTVTRPGA